MFKRTFWLAVGFGLGVVRGRAAASDGGELTPETFGDRVRERMADAVDARRSELRAATRPPGDVAAPTEPARPGARAASGPPSGSGAARRASRRRVGPSRAVA